MGQRIEGKWTATHEVALDELFVDGFYAVSGLGGLHERREGNVVDVEVAIVPDHRRDGDSLVAAQQAFDSLVFGLFSSGEWA